jgi:hypothetical protein
MMLSKFHKAHAIAAAIILAGMVGSAPAFAQTVWGGGVVVSPSPYGYGYYDYAPGAMVTVPDAYDAAPYSYSYSATSPDYSYDYGWRRPGHCHMSIRGC